MTNSNYKRDLSRCEHAYSLLCNGYSYTRIAAEMNISQRRVSAMIKTWEEKLLAEEAHREYREGINS